MKKLDALIREQVVEMNDTELLGAISVMVTAWQNKNPLSKETKHQYAHVASTLKDLGTVVDWTTVTFEQRQKKM